MENKTRDEGMLISLNSVNTLLKSKGLALSVSDKALSFERFRLIAPQVKDVLFDYAEGNPNTLNKFRSSIITYTPKLKQECP